jgi:hypothetical protein
MFVDPKPNPAMAKGTITYECRDGRVRARRPSGQSRSWKVSDVGMDAWKYARAWLEKFGETPISHDLPAPASTDRPPPLPAAEGGEPPPLPHAADDGAPPQWLASMSSPAPPQLEEPEALVAGWVQFLCGGRSSNRSSSNSSRAAGGAGYREGRERQPQQHRRR